MQILKGVVFCWQAQESTNLISCLANNKHRINDQGDHSDCVRSVYWRPRWRFSYKDLLSFVNKKQQFLIDGKKKLPASKTNHMHLLRPRRLKGRKIPRWETCSQFAINNLSYHRDLTATCCKKEKTYLQFLVPLPRKLWSPSEIDNQIPFQIETKSTCKKAIPCALYTWLQFHLDWTWTSF